jgi:LuxR family maltose regulon positive regulatory protein
MPRVPLHILTWSSEYHLYELYTQGQPQQRFRPGEEAAWQTWLGEATSFAFQGAAGKLNVYHEARPRGGQYWYAYHTAGTRARKRYLGQTATISFARLEEAAQILSRESAPPPSASSSTQRGSDQPKMLLLTKLAVPRLPNGLVERERLLAELDDALSKPLTLLTASAGWGKTTLLASWASRHAQAVAWLSLDSLDNDAFRFWAAVIAALRTRVPGIGALALSMLHSPQPPPFSALLTALLNDLAEVGESAGPLVLLLDDYQMIADPVIHETLAFWVEHLPTQVHLLLASRVDPDLPLPRWRARGQLLELRTDEVRFHPQEAGLFLRQTMGLSLSEAEVAALESRTEGWVAGLQLAALSLRQQPDRAAWIATFRGSHRYILDYVQQEILQQQPQPIQRFLWQVAILTRMNAALCRAVTGEPASQEILETLERENLFVVPLDEQRQWYRLHDLFREALLTQVQASQPDLLPHVHQRAAQWYEAQGELREAIVHALSASDFLYAARLLERAAPSLWQNGELQAVLSWIAALPNAVLFSHARLALDAVRHVTQSILVTVQASYAPALALVEHVLGRLEMLVQRRTTSSAGSEAGEAVPVLPDAEKDVVQRRLRLLRALLASRAMLLRDDAEEMRQVVEGIAGLSEQEVSWKVAGLLLTFWLTVTLRREGASLIEQLRQAKREAREAEDHRAVMYVTDWLAVAYLVAGRWHLDEQECLEGLALAERISIRTHMTGYLYANLAAVNYAWNRLEEAAACVRQTLSIAQTWQHAGLLMEGHLMLAQIDLARGELAAAAQVLQQAEALIQQEPMVYAAPLLAALRVQYWLATGDLAHAATWAAHTAFHPQTWSPNQAPALLMQVRVHLAQQHYSLALETLERWSPYLDRPADGYTTAQFLALKVVAQHQGGKRQQATHDTARLLALTEPEGDIRVYLDLGTPMKRVLTMLLEARPGGDSTASAVAISRPYVSRLLEAFEQEEQQNLRAQEALPVTRHKALAHPSQATMQRELTEPLSRQEHQVLRLLVAGRTYAEMAQVLIVSPNTIKTQVSSIYRKLGVSRRAEAIALAQRLPLLSREAAPGERLP